MERIAIIDHSTHTLYVEDIDSEDLENIYGGSEEEYIKQNFFFEDDGDYSWDYISATEYFPIDIKEPIDVEFEKLNK